MQTVAYSINDNGQIAGASYSGEGIFFYGRALDLRAFLWENGEAIDLEKKTTVVYRYSANNEDPDVLEPEVLDNYYSRAFSINNKGQVVGELIDPVNTNRRAFLWQDTTMILLPGNSLASAAYSINDKSQIVGFGGIHAALWEVVEEE